MAQQGEEDMLLRQAKAVLDYNKVASAPYAYDAKLAFTVNAPTGALVASATVPYQLATQAEPTPRRHSGQGR